MAQCALCGAMSRLFRAAGAISLLTLGSRVLGLWRDSVMAAVLGAGRVSDTFLLAWAFPNMMRRLLGEGALSASFVPAYTRNLQTDDGEQRARQLLQDVLGAMLILLLPLLLVVPAVVLMATLDAPDRLLPGLSTVLFPYTVPICLAAMLSGAWNARGSFALPAAIPIVLNLVWISALYLAPWFGCETDESIAWFLAWALLLGGILQLAMVAVPLLRQGGMNRPRTEHVRWPTAGTPARLVFATMLPTVIGMSLGQLSALIDQVVAYGLLADGSNTYLYLANRMLLFPHALTALAVVTVVFPRLASEATDQDRLRMRATLDRAAAATLFVTLPAAVGMILIADDVIAVLFQHRKFGGEDAAQTALTTKCLVAGLPFLGLAQLYARAFYAVGDTRRPAIVAAVLLGVGTVSNLVMVLGFGFSTEALAAATSATALLNAVVLGRRVTVHVPAAESRQLPAAWARCVAGTAAMAVSVLVVRSLVDVESTGRLLGGVMLPIAAGITTYALAQVALRSPDLRSLRRPRS
jgi:putative peptidoglycan lipid II flippase